MRAPSAHSRGEEAAAYVLGHMDAAERIEFVKSMNEDRTLRAFVDDLSKNTAVLALYLPQVQAPAGARERILERIKGLSQDASGSIQDETPVMPKVRKPMPAWVGWAAAVVLLVPIGLAVKEVMNQKQLLAVSESQVAQYEALAEKSKEVEAKALEQIQTLIAKLNQSDKTANELQNQLAKSAEVTDDLKKQLVKADATTQMLQQEIAQRTKAGEELKAELAKLIEVNDAAKMQIATLQSTVKEYKQGVAVVVWNSQKQEGILKLEKMPPLDDNKDYQLWVVDPAQKAPVNAGVVAVDKKGFARITFKPVIDIQQANNFALSVEKKGGVPQGEGPIVLMSH